jgi:hypothetical protein
MTGNGKSTRRGKVLRYFAAAVFLLLAAVSALRGGRWYETAIMAVAALMFFLGSSRRIYRPAVNRSERQVICRFIPWFESLVYFCGILIPAIGVAGFSMGSNPGYPGFFRYGGIFLICVGVLFMAGFLCLWRMCRLSITPTTLTIRLPAGPLRRPTDIRREHVQSIEPKIVETNMGVRNLKTEMVFRADGADDTMTVVLGQQFTVEPMNLLGGLLAWRAGGNEDPGELMDRIEGILRGRSTAEA